MLISDLAVAVREHAGTFLCVEINNEVNTRNVHFTHVVTEPEGLAEAPDVGDLQAFFSQFGSVVFYYDAVSGDAGKYLAPVDSWPELHTYFSGWLDIIPEDEQDDELPPWARSSLVIGGAPQSANYILVPTEGEEAGQVYEFDHDGFVFVHVGYSLADYVQQLLKPNAQTLTDLASHMRFMGHDDSHTQWWIREMRDNRRHTVKTTV